MENSLIIRQEQDADHNDIRKTVRLSFAEAEHTDNDEHNLIDRLRETADYIPELSLVAEINGSIVGYIMFSRIYISDTEAIALAPLAVLPFYRKQGIGQALINAGHHKAHEMGYCCSVVLGSPDYYSRSGYQPASAFGISAPFEVPNPFYMVYPLKARVPKGRVVYSDAFRL